MYIKISNSIKKYDEIIDRNSIMHNVNKKGIIKFNKELIKHGVINSENSELKNEEAEINLLTPEPPCFRPHYELIVPNNSYTNIDIETKLIKIDQNQTTFELSPTPDLTLPIPDLDTLSDNTKSNTESFKASENNIASFLEPNKMIDNNNFKDISTHEVNARIYSNHNLENSKVKAVNNCVQPELIINRAKISKNLFNKFNNISQDEYISAEQTELPVPQDSASLGDIIDFN